MGTYNDISNNYLQTIALILQRLAIAGSVLHMIDWSGPTPAYCKARELVDHKSPAVSTSYYSKYWESM